MTSFEPTIDATFREYADMQLRRHNLLAEGKEKGPEFDGIEDKMTELWDKLDVSQRNSVNGMASDLNWIRRNGQAAPKGRKGGEVTATEHQNLLAARAQKDWHTVLHYLRVCAPAIPPANLANLRGNAYDAIGFPSYASGFFDLAAELESDLEPVAWPD